jgi:hypothetical protein
VYTHRSHNIERLEKIIHKNEIAGIALEMLRRITGNMFGRLEECLCRDEVTSRISSPINEWHAVCFVIWQMHIFLFNYLVFKIAHFPALLCISIINLFFNILNQFSLRMRPRTSRNLNAN